MPKPVRPLPVAAARRGLGLGPRRAHAEARRSAARGGEGTASTQQLDVPGRKVAAYEPKPVQGRGQDHGQGDPRGPAPEVLPLKRTKDPGSCGANGPDESLVLGAAGEVANAVVTVEAPSGKKLELPKEAVARPEGLHLRAARAGAAGGHAAGAAQQRPGAAGQARFACRPRRSAGAGQICEARPGRCRPLLGEIDLPAVYDTLKALVGRVAGDGLANLMEARLKDAGKPAGLSALEIIKAFKGRGAMVLRIDPVKNITLATGSPVTIPDFSLLVRYDAGPVMKRCYVWKPSGATAAGTSSSRTPPSTLQEIEMRGGRTQPRTISGLSLVLYAVRMGQNFCLMSSFKRQCP